MLIIQEKRCKVTVYSGELSRKKYSSRKLGYIEELRTSSMVWECHGLKITDFMLCPNLKSLNTLNFISHLHFRVIGCLSFFEGTS